MATTSLWRIKGNMSGAINYVENDEKTMEVMPSKDKISHDTLDDVVAYVERNNATHERKYVTGLGVDPDKARSQMLKVKQHFGKTDGTLLYHGYQSFKGQEVSPQQAHDIGVKMAQELWADRYQVLVCTHLDKASHIHNHFLINTVSFIDGKKFFRSATDYKHMQEVSDRLCRENGLSIVKRPEHSGKQYGQWLAEKNGKPTYHNMIRDDIDRAIKASLTEREFYRILEGMGYEFKFYAKSGKELTRPSLKPKGSSKFFRFDNLGEDYTIDEISNRILENIRREDLFPEETEERYREHRRVNPPRTKKKGLAALYYHYCYELHIIVIYPTSVKRVSSFLREDIRKMERLDAQTRFLGEKNIETFEDLEKYKGEARDRTAELMQERNSLRNQLKRELRANNMEGGDATRGAIAYVTEQLKKVREEMEMCECIEERSVQMQEELKLIKEQIGVKEETKNELWIGRSGPDRENVTQRS